MKPAPLHLACDAGDGKDVSMSHVQTKAKEGSVDETVSRGRQGFVRFWTLRAKSLLPGALEAALGDDSWVLVEAEAGSGSEQDGLRRVRVGRALVYLARAGKGAGLSSSVRGSGMVALPSQLGPPVKIRWHSCRGEAEAGMALAHSGLVGLSSAAAEPFSWKGLSRNPSGAQNLRMSGSHLFQCTV